VRIKDDLPDLYEKKYWIKARAELRRQVGTLRYDMNNLAAAKGLKPSTNSDVFAKLEAFDLQLVKKDLPAAQAAYATAVSALDAKIAEIA